jgi:cysteine synthase B
MILTSIVEHIGNTPLLLIPEEVHGISGLEIYAKLEYLNPF